VHHKVSKDFDQEIEKHKPRKKYIPPMTQLPASDASSREHINTAVMHDEPNMILVKLEHEKRENLLLIFNPLQGIIENY